MKIQTLNHKYLSFGIEISNLCFWGIVISFMHKTTIIRLGGER